MKAGRRLVRLNSALMHETPNYPAQKLLELAARAMGAGKFPEAERHLRNVLLHDSENPVALHLLGLRAYVSGNRGDARRMVERAVKAAPESVEILTTFGTMLHELGEPREALDVFLRILSKDTSSPEIWNAAGICFQETDQPALAVEFYLRALSLRPSYAEAHSNLGAVLIHEGDTEGAVEHLLEGRSLDPTIPDIHHNLGIALRNRFEYAAAIASFREGLRLKPDSANILGSLGEVLSLVGDAEAEGYLRRSVELRPDEAEKHWNFSHCLLKSGNYAEGWREYEWRWKRTKNQKPLRPFVQPLWRGEPGQSIAGKTILLSCEQGFGDTLQFLRYVPLVLAQGALVVLEVQPALKRLVTEYARGLDPAIVVVGEGEALPVFDWHTPLMSLPLAFGTTLETVPAARRFTAPAAERAAAWPLRAGIAWSGNPKHDRDRERSIPTEALGALFEVPGCSWVSLQVNAPEELGLPHERPELRDFLDTAELLDTLDLVVTVDTSVAHLAASQGIPTWILLPYVAEWRWLQPSSRGDVASGNAWYPEARLFRQRMLPDGRAQGELWRPLIAEVAEALRGFVEARGRAVLQREGF